MSGHVDQQLNVLGDFRGVEVNSGVSQSGDDDTCAMRGFSHRGREMKLLLRGWTCGLVAVTSCFRVGCEDDNKGGDDSPSL